MRESLANHSSYYKLLQFETNRKAARKFHFQKVRHVEKLQFNDRLCDATDVESSFSPNLPSRLSSFYNSNILPHSSANSVMRGRKYISQRKVKNSSSLPSNTVFAHFLDHIDTFENIRYIIETTLLHTKLLCCLVQIQQLKFNLIT